MPELLSFPSFDTTPLPYQQWSNSEAPRTIIVCLHGFCGASYDFTQFAELCIEQVRDVKIVAFNLRGMGLDPVESRRGNIDSSEDWIRDQHYITRQLRVQHPNSQITWCGESLGAVIGCHSYASASSHTEQCDALILFSPVVSVTHKIPQWILRLARSLALILPKKTITLNTLTAGSDVKVTQGSDSHQDQSATNSWHVEKFSLRTLYGIGSLIDSMPNVACSLTCPTLIINGGNDFFTPTKLIKKWLTNFPQTTQIEHHYQPSAYHLILYDDQAAEIFDVAATWLNRTILNFPIASHQ